MNILSSLVILASFVSCNGQEVTEYCEDQCKNVCIPCHDVVLCTEVEKDCGLGKPDPAFGGVCPPHEICVPKEFNCK